MSLYGALCELGVSPFSETFHGGVRHRMRFRHQQGGEEVSAIKLQLQQHQLRKMSTQKSGMLLAGAVRPQRINIIAKKV